MVLLKILLLLLQTQNKTRYRGKNTENHWIILYSGKTEPVPTGGRPEYSEFSQTNALVLNIITKVKKKKTFRSRVNILRNPSSEGGVA